ncbi:hypothetical protein Sjap_009737 [Stephania japonica]|uniref:S-adenosyl-L-methionine-dependent methyltransferase n=1 Tax=Stephania japonica TaxID=461633 RepID=A0AAP0P5R4_9MAGN
MGWCLVPSSPLLGFNAFRLNTNRSAGFRAKLSPEDHHPLLKSATNGATLRFQESLRPEPLFLDPYAGCFVPLDVQKALKHQNQPETSSAHFYCVATKFIDDQLIGIANRMDGVKQVVLLTDGMDTRPYRLKWPNSTIIFDISPERVFQRASEKLQGVGANVPRSCMLLHISSESSSIQDILCKKGFNSNQPSVWVMQGLPVITLASFEEILLVISSLASKGCKFIGDLPAWLVETEIGTKCNARKWMDKLFLSNAFRVDTIAYEEVARDLGTDLPAGEYEYLLFIAEQLRLSDGQMDSWRREFQRLEEDGDEEGFEEL